MSRVMKLVNSAFYAVSERVYSLEQAISMLGVVTVKKLALTASTLEAMQFPSESISITSKELWSHCLHTAVTCKVLGRMFAVKDYDEELFFITGLLHDIGKLAFIKAAPLRYDSVLWESKNLEVSLVFAEKAHFGCSHDEVGRVMAERWKLDKRVISCIQSHRAREAGSDSCDNQDLLRVLVISNNLCKREGMGFGGNVAIEEKYRQMFAKYGAFESEARSCIDAVKKEFENLWKTFL